MPSTIKVTVAGDVAPLNVAMGSATRTLAKFGGDAEVAAKAVVSASAQQMEALKALSAEYKAIAGSSEASAEEQAAAAKLAADSQKKLAAAMGVVQAESKKTAISTGLMGKAITAAFSVSIIGAGVKATVGAAMDFQKSMELIRTQAGASQHEVDSMSKALLRMASSVGTTPDKLAEGLYHLESAGMRGRKALDALRVAAEGAKVGNANLEDVTNALNAVIVSGIKGSGDLSSAMGALNATVGAGDMRMQDLAEAMGTGLPAKAKVFGVSLRDINAALAVFGDSNIRGAEAGTLLASAMRLMAAPSKASADALGRIGLSASALANDLRTGGFVKAITDLKKHMDDLGLSATQQAQVLTRAFGGRQSAGILILMDQLDRLKKKVKEVGDGANSFGAAWAATQKTAAFSMDRFHASVQMLEITIGNQLIPIVARVANAISDWLAKTQNQKRVTDDIKTAIRDLSTVVSTASGVIGKMADALKTVVGALGGWKTAGEIALAAFAASKFAGIFNNFIAFGRQAVSTAAVVNGASETEAATAAASASIFEVSWVGALSAMKAALISTGIGALLVGIGLAAVEVIKHWDTVKAWLGAFAAWMTNHWKPIVIAVFGPIGAVAVEIIDHWKGLRDWFEKFAHDFAGLFSHPIAALKAMFKDIGSGLFAGLKTGIQDFVNAIASIKIHIKTWHGLPDGISIHWAGGGGDSSTSYSHDQPNVSGDSNITGGAAQHGALTGSVVSNGTTQMTPAQVFSLLKQAGFSDSAAQNFVGIARAESGLNYNALNNNPSTGDYSAGLFQENFYQSLGPARTARYAPQFGLSGNMSPAAFVAWLRQHPEAQAKIAYQLSSGGTNYQPWMGDAYVKSHPELLSGGGGGGGGGGGTSLTGNPNFDVFGSGKKKAGPGGMSLIPEALKQKVAAAAAKAVEDIAGGLPDLAIGALNQEAKGIQQEISLLKGKLGAKGTDSKKTQAAIDTLTKTLNSIHSKIVEEYAADLKKETDAAKTAASAAASAFGEGKTSAAVKALNQEANDLKKAEADLTKLIANSSGAQKAAYEKHLASIKASLAQIQKDKTIPEVIAEETQKFASEMKALTAQAAQLAKQRQSSAELQAVGYFGATQDTVTALDESVASNLQGQLDTLNAEKAKLQASLAGADKNMKAALGAKIKGITTQIQALTGNVGNAVSTVYQDLVSALQSAQAQFQSAVSQLQDDLDNQLQQNALNASGYTADQAQLQAMQTADTLQGYNDAVATATKQLQDDMASGSSAEILAADQRQLDAANRQIAEYNLQTRATAEQAAASAKAASDQRALNAQLTEYEQELISGKITATQFQQKLAQLQSQFGVTISNSVTPELMLVASSARQVTNAFNALIAWVNKTTGSNIPSAGSSTPSALIPVGNAVSDWIGGGGTGSTNTGSGAPAPTGGSCFVAGTLVRTPEGERPIEEIQVGDQVLVWDFTEGRFVGSPVGDLLVHGEDELSETLEIQAGSLTVVTTAEHPFYSSEGWVAAGTLKDGDRVAVSANGFLIFLPITRRSLPGLHVTYNLHVEHPDHNYVAEGFLVHNFKAADFYNGGVVHALGGLMVPGLPRSSDYIPAMLNGGEMILNQGEQARLWNMIKNAGPSYGSASPGPVLSTGGGDTHNHFHFPNYVGDKQELLNLLRTEVGRMKSRGTNVFGLT